MRKKRPSFVIASGEGNVTFVCRVGVRGWTRTRPCQSPFKVPNLGPGRHVLVVQVIQEDGQQSQWVKFAYFVSKQSYK